MMYLGDGMWVDDYDMERMYQEACAQRREEERRRNAHPKNATIRQLEQAERADEQQQQWNSNGNNSSRNGGRAGNRGRGGGGRGRGSSSPYSHLTPTQQRVEIIKNAPIHDLIAYKDENGKSLLHRHYRLPAEEPVLSALLARMSPDDDRLRMRVEAGGAISDYLAGCTPLHYHVYHSHAGMCRALLDAGADVNARNDAGMTPIMLLSDAPAVLDVLSKDSRCDFNLSAHDGRTAIYHAVVQEEWGTVEKLIGLMVAQRDAVARLHGQGVWTGLTGTVPFDAISVQRCSANGGRVLGLILEKTLSDPAQLSVVDKNGFTPFQKAIRDGSSLCSAFLKLPVVRQRYPDVVGIKCLMGLVDCPKGTEKRRADFLRALEEYLERYQCYVEGCCGAATATAASNSTFSPLLTKLNSSNGLRPIDIVLENVNYRLPCSYNGSECNILQHTIAACLGRKHFDDGGGYRSSIPATVNARPPNDSGQEDVAVEAVRLLLAAGADPNGRSVPIPSLMREGDLAKQQSEWPRNTVGGANKNNTNNSAKSDGGPSRRACDLPRLVDEVPILTAIHYGSLRIATLLMQAKGFDVTGAPPPHSVANSSGHSLNRRANTVVEGCISPYDFALKMKQFEIADALEAMTDTESAVSAASPPSLATAVEAPPAPRSERDALRYALAVFTDAAPPAASSAPPPPSPLPPPQRTEWEGAPVSHAAGSIATRHSGAPPPPLRFQQQPASSSRGGARGNHHGQRGGGGWRGRAGRGGAHRQQQHYDPYPVFEGSDEEEAFFINYGLNVLRHGSYY